MNDTRLDYESIEDVIRITTGVLVLDLMSYAYRFTEDQLEALKPPPRGVYISGSLMPLINLDKQRYFICSAKNGEAVVEGVNYLPVITPEQILESPHPIFSQDGRKVLNNPKARQVHLTTECSLPYSAINLLSTLIYREMRSVIRRESVIVMDNACRLDLRSIEDFCQLPDNSKEFRETFEQSRVINSLYRELYKFTEHYEWHQYFIKLTGTTIIIERGNDYRIIEYYRRIFEEIDEQHERDYG